jgi:hypothetical protein
MLTALGALAVLFCLVTVTQAAPADVFVNQTGPWGSTTFSTIQAGINAVAVGGRVHVSPGTYKEDLAINAAVTLLGPNAGVPGAGVRGSEAVLMPVTDDAANGQIIYVGASQVTIDGFLFNGDNPTLNGGYHVGTGTAEANTSAAIQNTDFWTTDFAQIDHLRVQNNIFKNISYDGIYLEVNLGSANGYNYILNNKFDTMWEGVQTYAMPTVISDNTFVSVNRGLSVHAETTAPLAGFTPAIANNTFTIGEWWPAEIARVYSAGIWVNYRRGDGVPLDVTGNVVNTPVAAPGKVMRGLYALNLSGNGSVDFINNTVNGNGYCHQGMYVAMVPGAGTVTLQGGALNNIREEGVMATTSDYWGTGDVQLTVSGVTITAGASAKGVVAYQDNLTPANKAHVEVLANSHITGGLAGVQVQGAKGEAVVRNNTATITGALIGIDVIGGKALVENNNLIGHALAAISVQSGGIVDAGNCGQGDVTGLGVSAGGNNLSGYGFDGTAPWAVQNLGGTALAYQDNFGAAPGQKIGLLLSGSVPYSQGGGLLVSCPPTIAGAVFQCLPSIPAPYPDFSAFQAAGGVVSASGVSTMSSSDSMDFTPPGLYTVTRAYAFTDACGQSGSCAQTILIQDITAPTITAPAPVTVNTDSGRCYASGVVLGTPAASDNCGTVHVSNNAPAQFPRGQTTVTWTASDDSGNSSTATQLVTVVDNQAPVFVSLSPPSGAVDWYHAEGNADDSVGSHHGVANGGLSYAAGQTGQAFSFNGVNSYVELGTFFNLQSFSIVLWVNPSASQVPWADIIDNKHSLGKNWVIQQEGSSADTTLYYFYDGSTFTFFHLTPGVWNHLAVTRSSGNLNTVYVNGVAAGSTPSSAIPYDSPDLKFGAWGNGGRNWNGLADEIVFYARELSSAEVEAMYGSGGACPNSITVNVLAGTTSSIVTYNTPAAVDNCSVTTVQTAGLPSGAAFPLGTTANHFIATDAQGNTAECSFSVTVQVITPDLRVVSYVRNTGAATLSLTGAPGVTYGIETTTDFTHWTQVASGAAPFTYVDTSGGTRRFYRAVYPAH